MKPITYAQPPVELSMLEWTEPQGEHGCDVCRALAGRREEARRQGDLSRVSDCNVEIRQHPHGRTSRV
ncbi:hypothetical protein FNJ62_13185 [Streptomyces benahoarensis]|uniref:Uncharacterized protein n=1 Tax=Streptomyces benahoarensis TaxID=2595054 RepID=A0A553ZCN1_9ACTN|nr:hypothetical protein FNJ62_13185 [Streptomyces benahoarensis]TSB39169.1 hypothetical protein FNZ23_15860 [Streptomyces benahoarensis]